MAMKWIMLMTMMLMTMALFSEAAVQQPLTIKSEKDRLSYALGQSLGSQLRQQSVEIDLDLYVQGLEDALSGGKVQLSEADVRAVIMRLQDELKKKQAGIQAEQARAQKELAEKKKKELAALAEKNKADGDAFLAKNKAGDGIVTLESGLQYKILKQGNGKKPTLADTIVCQYLGTLIDGTEFDSSYKRNQPSVLSVQKVIRGWREALALMPVGSRWQLFIPPSLAYGDRAVGTNIGPNATLIFEVELLSVNEPIIPSPAIEDLQKAADRISGAGDGVRLEAPGAKAVAAVPPLAAINVSFKMDPRVTKGMYMGERWISPPTYSIAQEGRQCVVEARAQGLDAMGKAVQTLTKWIPSDPEMVKVTTEEGNTVKITVDRPGECSLEVAAQGISKIFAVKAEHKGTGIQVAISQK